MLFQQKLYQRVVSTNCINESIKKNEFPNELKAAGITPVFKKEDPPNKENYRPVMWSQQYLQYLKEYYLTNLQNFQFLSPLLYGFRKGYSTQYALNMHNLLQTWKKVLMNLTKLLTLC